MANTQPSKSASTTDAASVPTNNSGTDPMNQINASSVLNPIILLEPVMLTVEILSVKHVKTENDEFVSIVGKHSGVPVTVACSINQYEKMGIASLLPIGACGDFAEMLVVQVPADGHTYGYKTKTGEVVAYTRQGRTQLVQVHAVNVADAHALNKINSNFKLMFGHPYDPTNATEREQNFFGSMLQSVR